MRKYTIIAFILLISILSGCSQKMPYEIVYEDGKTYLLLPEAKTGENTDDTESEMLQAPWVHFENIEEMVSDINTGNFTENELDQLSRFPVSTHRVEVPTLSYIPSYPADYIDYDITWYPNKVSYTLYLVQKEDQTGPDEVDFFSLVPESEVRIEAERWNRLDEVNSQLTAMPLEDRNAILYTNPSGEKSIHYTIETEGKVLYIAEYYTPEDIIKSVIIHGSENGCFFRVSCGDKVITSRPSIEWLSQFGIIPYEAE